MVQSGKVSKALGAYLKECQEIRRRMNTIVAPILKQLFEERIQPIIDSQQALYRDIEPVFSKIEVLESSSHSIQLPKITLPDLASLTKQVEEFRRSINGLVPE